MAATRRTWRRRRKLQVCMCAHACVCVCLCMTSSPSGPSAKAWGHSKKTFYQGADVMDDELGPEEEEEMEEEEREARSLQQRMAESMEDIDFLPAEIQVG